MLGPLLTQEAVTRVTTPMPCLDPASTAHTIRDPGLSTRTLYPPFFREKFGACQGVGIMGYPGGDTEAKGEAGG
jgi:hypothetical protein